MAAQRAKLELIAPEPSPLEAAAIVAALEHFTHEVASVASPARGAPNAWLRVALFEGVARAERTEAYEPWINT
jgi:hypothetical protein